VSAVLVLAIFYKVIYFVVFCVMCFAVVTGVNAAPVQWQISAGGNDHWYEAVSVPDGITWSNANSAATAMGGYLATITSAAENTFVYSLVDADIYWTNIDGVDTAGPWLGGFDSGGWKWVTGEPFSYTNWYPGDPNYRMDPPYTYPQDALVMYGSGPTIAYRSPMWDDDWHSNPHEVSYVVEFVPEPSSLALLGIGAISLFAYTWQRRQRRAV